jgi:hypothetical protein
MLICRYPHDPKPSTTYTLAYVLLYILVIYSIFLRIVQIWYFGRLNKQKNVFSEFGIFNLILNILLLLITPIYSVGDTKVTFLKEEYYDSDSATFPTFTRNYNEYLIIIGITIHFLSYFYNVNTFSQWLSLTNFRICRLYRITNIDPMHTLKSFLNDDPLFITFFILINWAIFFTILISITENGYLRDLDTTGLTGDDLTNAINGRSVFYTFNVIFWNVFITFTTIGKCISLY